MKINVIILAQGTQQRLPGLDIPKQLLGLPACKDLPILVRTVAQITKLAVDRDAYVRRDAARDHVMHIITWDATRDLLPSWVRGACTQLTDPGNSSLKGVARVLELRSNLSEFVPVPERTVVLLGDVVYSWRCLEILLAVGENLQHGKMGYLFVGTKDLSPSGGELWGLTWTREADDFMMLALRRALLKHPPFGDTYQPGQMRRWLWEIDSWIHHYACVDDYTRDIDLPEHLALLPALSEAAAADDREHGVIW